MPWVKKLPDGRVATIQPLLWGAALVTIAEHRSWSAGRYDEAWTYPTVLGAFHALEAWDGEGEPEGWIRHRPSNRRRPDGDPAQEFVRP